MPETAPATTSLEKVGRVAASSEPYTPLEIQMAADDAGLLHEALRGLRDLSTTLVAPPASRLARLLETRDRVVPLGGEAFTLNISHVASGGRSVLPSKAAGPSARRDARSGVRPESLGRTASRLLSTSWGPSHEIAWMTVPAVPCAAAYCQRGAWSSLIWCAPKCRIGRDRK